MRDILEAGETSPRLLTQDLLRSRAFGLFRDSGTITIELSSVMWNSPDLSKEDGNSRRSSTEIMRETSVGLTHTEENVSDEDETCVRLCLLGATDLMPIDTTKPPDPYAEIVVNEKVIGMTGWDVGTLNPNWNRFDGDIYFELGATEQRILRVKTLDRLDANKLASVLLGSMSTKISDILDLQENVKHTLPLERSETFDGHEFQGSITFKFTRRPPSGRGVDVDDDLEWVGGWRDLHL
jgi:Ca2+-dependent lipid-binding protein